MWLGLQGHFNYDLHKWFLGFPLLKWTWKKPKTLQTFQEWLNKRERHKIRNFSTITETIFIGSDINWSNFFCHKFSIQINIYIFKTHFKSHSFSLSFSWFYNLCCELISLCFSYLPLPVCNLCCQKRYKIILICLPVGGIWCIEHLCVLPNAVGVQKQSWGWVWWLGMCFLLAWHFLALVCFALLLSIVCPEPGVWLWLQVWVGPDWSDCVV